MHVSGTLVRGQSHGPFSVSLSCLGRPRLSWLAPALAHGSPSPAPGPWPVAP